MSEPAEKNTIKNQILGYGFILEKCIISEYKRIYPRVDIREVEQTERPTIDVSEYDKKPGKALNANSEGFSFFRADPAFRAEPGFKPKINVPSGRKIISFVDETGKIRYKYND